ALAGRRARVVLRKRIGVGAGLGGGSADAAAVLRWANSDLAPGERPVDVARACRLGADVGFCLAGGRARVTGIGDRVSALGFERQDFTLLTPPFAVSSADVYAAWDGLPDVVPDVVPAGLAAGAVNDLEPAALAVAPELALWRDALAAQTGLRPRLAGSGATWFVEGRFPDVSHAGVAGR
ncbi:MAG TPA: 4-(cytidine 5'-diphospho)-2-C-methyl-D-erythritol kinase, partial [Acidimicrobiaceae bacterium]|nr:4-(cytidine 5'-diphospho)-2-C-methyl-D-erythritol kinase [Acidimicrobiaceae bacterium]